MEVEGNVQQRIGKQKHERQDEEKTDGPMNESNVEGASARGWVIRE